jgi:phosphoribosylanthranilate isomerase
MTLVQIYEVQTPQEAEKMIALGVDHIGSVLQAQEQWQDTALQGAIKTVQHAGLKSSLIPLFADTDRMSNAIDYYQPDIIHFCEALNRGPGDWRAILERQITIRERFPQLAIMRSIPIAPNGSADQVPSLEIAQLFEPFSDWFLTDTLLVSERPKGTRQQPVSGFVGITGQTCDWTVAARLVMKSAIPVILAGGIGPDNVEAGVKQVKPAGVDSCTRTNATDDSGRVIRFRKDPVKVSEMIIKIRNLHLK